MNPFPPQSGAALLILAVAAMALLPPQTAEAASFKDLLKKAQEIGDVVRDQLDTAPQQPEGAADQPVPPPTSGNNTGHPPPEVQRIQYLLDRLGYQPGPADGAYGPGTAKAIARYQADHGLAPTGVPSSELMMHLEVTLGQQGTVAGAGTPPSQTGTGSAVAPPPASPAPQASAGGAAANDSLVAPAPSAAMPTGAPAAGTSPVRSHQPAAAASAPSTAATTDAVAAGQAGLRVVRGRPVLINEGWTGTIEREGVLRADQIAAMRRFLDHLRLGLNSDLAGLPEPAPVVPTTGGDGMRGRSPGALQDDHSALCAANRLLGAEARREILQSEVDPSSGKRQFSNWKGSPQRHGAAGNEFETHRAKARYNELLPALVATAPPLPMKFVLIEPLMLQSYSHASGGFPFEPPKINLPRSDCFGTDYDYLPLAAELPSLWPMDPQAAEATIQKLPVDTSFSGQQRKVFVAVELTLSGATESPMRSNYTGRSQVPMKIDVESVGLYEDADLERPLHVFGVDAPKPSALLGGTPDSVPVPDRPMLDDEFVTLLLLESRGDVLSRGGWNVLARRQSRNDKLYYDKEVYNRTGPVRVTKLDTFDPGHVPFFPRGVEPDRTSGLTDEQLAIFKRWSLERAAGLGEQFTLPATLVKAGANDDAEISLRAGVTDHGDPDSPKAAEAVVALGYAPGQIVHPQLANSILGIRTGAEFLEGAAGPRSLYLVFPNLLEEYVPDFNPQSAGYASWPMEMDVTVTSTELVPVDVSPTTLGGGPREVFLVHVEPHHVRLLAEDDRRILHEQGYRVAALKKGQQVAAGSDVTPPAPVMPFNAEFADLVIARFMPEALDPISLERMLIARWHYENDRAFTHGKADPDWGRFFVAGKGLAGAAERAGMLDAFRDWTLRRAKAMPTATSLVFSSSRLSAGPVSLGGDDPRFPQDIVRGWGTSCRSDLAVAKFNEPDHVERIAPVCTLAESIAAQPVGDIYLTRLGGTARLKPDERERELNRNAQSISGIGPRINCGSAAGVHNRNDPYCRYGLEALQGDLIGKPFTLDDLVVADKVVIVPDQPEITRRTVSGGAIALEGEIVGVRRVTRLPQGPRYRAFERYFAAKADAGFQIARNDATPQSLDYETVPIFLMDLRVKRAAYVDASQRDVTPNVIAELELVDPAAAVKHLLSQVH